MNRFISALFAIVGAFVVPVFAQEAPHIIEAAPRVMVFPFTAIGDPGSYQWIGTGIQQSLLVEVNRPGSIAWTVSTAGPTTQPVSDPAADAARNGATLAVFGSYQIANDEIRVTGQATDPSTGQVLATLKATGPIHDLFKVEDTLDAQLQRALPQPQQPPMNAAVQDAQPAPVEPAPVVIENDVQPVEPSYAYADTYGLPYPYYSDYGYDGFYGGFISYGFPGGFYHHHDYHNFFGDQPIRDRGFGNDGFGAFGRGFGGSVGLNAHAGGLRTGGFASGFHSGGFGGGFHR